MDALREFDYAVFRDVNVGLHSKVLDVVFTAFSYTGLGASLALVFACLLLWKRTRRYFLPMILTLAFGGGVIADFVFKPHVERLRPSNLAFSYAEEPLWRSSFPSGHSCDAFGTAFAVLLLTWGTPYRKYGYLAVVWACLVGMSRIYRGVHWPTDVIAGCFVGLFSASVVVGGFSLYWKRKAESAPSTA